MKIYPVFMTFLFLVYKYNILPMESHHRNPKNCKKRNRKRNKRNTKRHQRLKKKKKLTQSLLVLYQIPDLEDIIR